MAQPARKILTTAQVAERLGVSTELVRQWALDGHLPSFVLPAGKRNHRRFAEADVVAFMASIKSTEAAS